MILLLRKLGGLGGSAYICKGYVNAVKVLPNNFNVLKCMEKMQRTYLQHSLLNTFWSTLRV